MPSGVLESLARRVLLWAVGAFLVAWCWARLERPRDLGDALAVAAVASLPLLGRRTWHRVALAGASCVAALHLAFEPSLLDARPFSGHDYFGPLAARFRDGFLGFYDVTLPFASGPRPAMHGVVLLAVFGFALVLALAVATRRPLVAGLAVVAGGGWPSTLLPGQDAALRGAFLLAAVLLIFAGLRTLPGRRAPQALVAGVLVAVCALAATASPAVAKAEFLAWKLWDPYDAPQDPVSVAYVWDSNYSGITYPKKKTTVLKVRASPKRMYWRATTLDTFVSDRWVESLRSAVPVRADGFDDLSYDRDLPRAARDRERWQEQEVTYLALRDQRLVAASVPVAFDPNGIDVQYATGGVAFAVDGVERGGTYRAWSFAPEATPRQLARSRARNPERLAARGFLDIESGRPAPPFGTPQRHEEMLTMLGYGGVYAYRRMYSTAREVVGDAASPYAAAVAIESWLRRTGGFRYDERPPAAAGVPPLVDFVTRTKAGYCQHYAGAMALMLRYLGIPSRVAVGFTSGDYDAEERTWTVTDHDAHAWVEVWFDGYGWLSFDPTPGRGTLDAPHSVSSTRFNPAGALAALAAGLGGRVLAERLGVSGADPGTGGVVAGERARTNIFGGAGIDPGGASRGESLARLLALIGVILVALVAFLKLVIRRGRFVTRDPRRVAAACRREVVDWLVDQRAPAARSMTLAELGELLRSRYGVDADDLVAAAGEARFGPLGEAPRAAERARRELRNVRRRFRRRLGAWQRVRGLVSIRSLGFR